ncbi:MAG: hypothetical protein IPG96_14630 [Proteobacteria bacterium]|nr:hypothetical protein [Pseudomonadota bacterium]
MRRSSIILPIALLTAAVGCGADDAGLDAYRRAVPTSAALSVDVPAGTKEATPGQAAQALTAQRAGLYNLTYTISRQANGWIGAGLQIVEAIVDYPPTSFEAGRAVWGPFTPALEPLSWTLEVTKTGEETYAYVLSARDKDQANDPMQAILSGTSVKGAGAPSVVGGYRGQYTLNFSALHALDAELYSETGTMLARYDLTGNERRLEMTLQDFVDDGDPAQDAEYGYVERADGSGEFRIAGLTDLEEDDSAQEHVVVRSTWNAQGAGRADAEFSGGNLSASVTATECWDPSFARSFYQDTIQGQLPGGELASCAFATAIDPDFELDLDLQSN